VLVVSSQYDVLSDCLHYTRFTSCGSRGRDVKEGVGMPQLAQRKRPLSTEHSTRDMLAAAVCLCCTCCGTCTAGLAKILQLQGRSKALHEQSSNGTLAGKMHIRLAGTQVLSSPCCVAKHPNAAQ
jgi:hypothetical protein